MNHVFLNVWRLLNSAFGVLFLQLTFLSLCAYFVGYRLIDDSFQHAQSSIALIQSNQWEAIVLDLWNKPFPTLLYGISGLHSIELARLSSVILVMLTALLAANLVNQILPQSYTSLGYPIISIALLLQPSVLGQSFLTMTELPAAFLLILGIYLFQRGRHYLSFFVLGCLPLARVEGALIMALAFVYLSLRQSPFSSLSACSRIFLQNLVGSFPFVCWWFLGFQASTDPVWLWKGSYAYLRSWDILEWLQVNAFNALPSTMGAPALLLCFLGCFSIHIDTSKYQISKLLFAMMGLHLVFLSAFVVYPEGSRFGDLAIGAINPRNFNVIAPLFCWFIVLGISRVHQNSFLQQTRVLSHLGVSLCLAQLALIGYFTLQQHFGTSLSKGVVKLGLHSTLLWATWYWVRRQVIQQRSASTLWIVWLTLGCLLTTPLFWYPLKSNDYQAQSQQAFCHWVAEQPYLPVQLVQDLNGSLNPYCALQFQQLPEPLQDVTPYWKRVYTPWTWAHFFEQVLEKADQETWLIVETIEAQPHSRYPEAFKAQLQDSNQYVELGSYQPSGIEAKWESLLQKISSKNIRSGWKVYRKIL